MTANDTELWGLCEGPLWNSSLTWYTSQPDFTQCFQDTVLVAAPCAFLLLLTPVHLYNLCHRASPPLPRGKLNTAKVFLSLMAALVVLLDLVKYFMDRSHGSPTNLAQLISPIILSFSLLLSSFLIILNRRHGKPSPALLFLFFCLLFTCGIVPFYSKILNATQQGAVQDTYRFTTFYIYFTLVTLQLFLQCFAEKGGYIHPKTCPEETSSFLSQVTFHWINSLVVTGFRKSLEEEDVWELNHRDKSVMTAPMFEKAWSTEMRTSKPSHYESLHSNMPRTPTIAEDERTPLLNRGVSATPSVEVVPTKKDKKPSLLRVLFKTYGFDLLKAQACKLVCDLLIFLGPILQSLLIEFTEEDRADKSTYRWRGYVYAALFFLYTILNSVFFQQVFHIGMTLGMRIKSALIAAVYKKALTINNQVRRDTAVGEIVNLMSVDVETVEMVVGYLWMLWSAPFQIAIATYFLYTLLGVSVFAGLAVIVLLFPLNGVLAAIQEKLRVKQMELKDSRIKIISEILNGIKVLKLYAWEPSFQDKVNVIRHDELMNLRKSSLLGGVAGFSWIMATFMVMLSSISTYVMTGHVLDAKTTFVALTLFNILQFPINILPMMLSFLVTSYVSVKRLNKFLQHDDIDMGNVMHTSSAEHAIEIKDGSFAWGTEEADTTTLKDINLQVAHGELIAVVGQVGCGKSSLISAILGEMAKLEGTVTVKGDTAYVAQQAWIQNATLKDNILFSQPDSEEKYNKVIEVCALKPDLEILPAGDQTEIGEKGINLSGGQKQRVSLARAVYEESDIYLLDDPLSAVDAHVGKHIFKEVISNNGILKGKTRILVTHGIHWLEQVDRIVVIVDGQISELGTFDELIEHKGPFAEFLNTYLLQEEDTENEDPEYAESRTALLEKIHSLPDDPDHVSNMASSPGSVGSQGSGRSTTPTRQISTSMKIARSVSQVSAHKGDNDDTGNQQQAKDRLIEEEKAEIGRVKWRVMLTYIHSIGNFNVLLMVITYTLYQAASIGGNMWLTEWTTDPVLQNASLANTSEYAHKRDVYLGVYGGLGCIQALLVLCFSIIQAVAMVRASGNLHAKMLARILQAPMSFFDTTPMGRIINRFSKDIETVDNVLPEMVYQWINSLFVVISSIIVISIATPLFLAMLIPLSIMYYFFQRFYVPTSRQLKRIESTTRSPIYAHFSETIGGTATIRAYKQQQRFVDRSAELVDHNLTFYFATIASNRWLGLRLDIISAFVVLGTSLFAVVGDASSALVGLALSYALQACQEFNWMVRMTSDLETNIVSVERVNEYTEIQTEGDWDIDETSPSPDWPDKGNIEFQDYAMRYRDGLDLVLQGIRLDIKGSEKVGIVGRTGAGKSSLTQALFRLVEAASGGIFIDGIQIEKLGLHQLRSRLTILPQDPVLFAGSLRLNLDPIGEYSDEQVWQAITRAHLRTFVEGLVAGLEHECGEGGQNLSVGQRQLVCLGRSLLRHTKVLVLDEATAAVDLETDDLIQKTIRTEFAECTILTIAHRLNTIMDSDRVLVLDKGQVAEFDTPDNLMNNKDSIFYSMAKEAGIIS